MAKSGFASGGVTCFYDSEELNQTGVLLMNICAKIPALPKQQNITEARLEFAVAIKTVIKNGLSILRVSVSERM